MHGIFFACTDLSFNAQLTPAVQLNIFVQTVVQFFFPTGFFDE